MDEKVSPPKQLRLPVVLDWLLGRSLAPAAQWLLPAGAAASGGIGLRSIEFGFWKKEWVSASDPKRLMVWVVKGKN